MALTQTGNMDSAFIIKTHRADSSVSPGADVGYSIADRLTDWG